MEDNKYIWTRFRFLGEVNAFHRKYKFILSIANYRWVRYINALMGEQMCKILMSYSFYLLV
jgi:hypothetical protein